MAISVFWFRRDLRLADNAGLYHALKGGLPVLPIFIFDRNILDGLEDRADRRAEFIHAALEEMQEQLIRMGSTLEVYYDDPLNAFRHLLTRHSVARVFANEDYEPYARDRDASVAGLLAGQGIRLSSVKDQVIFAKDEVMTGDGKPYTVFTPYSKKWLALLMHNRVRMITASFLAKHLLIDWRWGEAYFASKLLDFDLAANNGGWQWAAGCGCDAAPYFRVFNPTLQAQKFDPSLEYIRRWVPESEEFGYPPPMVDHAMARKRALEVYGRALKEHAK